MMDEENILPLLHRLKSPTFLTRDLGFYEPTRRHENYCIVCLAVGQKEAAHFVRRVLRHPSFNTKNKRLGTVIWASHAEIRVWKFLSEDENRIEWAD